MNSTKEKHIQRQLGMGRRPHVHVISLGGTIAMTRTGRSGAAPALDAHELISAVPGLVDVATVSGEAFLLVPGVQLTLADLVAVARRVDALIASGVDGVVITQGTDTIEESAFALDLLLDISSPVVVTGAMRTPVDPGSDGPGNLIAAVRTAADPTARERGVVVVLDDQIHAARYVTKVHTTRPSAFASPDAGPLGGIAGNVIYWTWPTCRSRSVSVPASTLPNVLLIPTWLGDDAALLGAACNSRPAGLVLEAMGAGHVPVALVQPLAEIARDIPVVLCSRVGCGPVLRNTYGFSGSESDLLGRGLIWGGSLPGRKARIQLTFALAAGWDRSRIVSGFTGVGGDG